MSNKKVLNADFTKLFLQIIFYVEKLHDWD